MRVAGAAIAVQACGYRPPRLPDGQADLQGVWANTNITPLERPPDFQSLVITLDEAAHLTARILARTENLTRPAEPTVYFSARSVECIDGEYRSSIIVEPKDGKIPGNEYFKSLTNAAVKAVSTAFDGPEARPGGDRCLSANSAAPPVTAVPAQIHEYACHEGNYALRNALLGGRATDSIAVPKE